ncbi:putative transcriptional regulator with CopG/Arc/MetJ DNA-binding domain and metal-binding domain [Halovivax ruber XH-70]|uniref:CopG family ribbon-helix-helix transcription regulator n=2 Tax=Halovivax TaxID=332951 RepID=M0BK16_9EURY|nr:MULTISPECIES: ribbon-helix-helix protein, CopG family [Halovivax]AGB17421.1 putative transcriptional regulator with CopG/Arc/MetJ DNA-binding domain and metal-binding domain [Halovivax ruber XH-70]ELZ09969.1 CopG family ribbon-helix-helix transcription regulator [Halovivax asiaticus JCM 14624]
MRLTVNLDDETSERLEGLSAAEGVSKSQIVRDAIGHYDRLQREWEQVEEERLQWYVRLLASSEHIILDVDHLDTLLDAVEDPEALVPTWRDIGRRHGIEWGSQFDSLEKKLRVLEYCNLFRITALDDEQFALTFNNETEATLIAAFIEGECEELGFDIDIRQIDRKLVVTDRTG